MIRTIQLIVPVLLLLVMNTAAQKLGEVGYIQCSSCQVPDDIPEGHQACYRIKTVYQVIPRQKKECSLECSTTPFGTASCQEVCENKWDNITIPICDLKRTNKGISKIQVTEQEHGTFSTIYTPRYYSDKLTYPNNIYCYYNVADGGEVNYWIFDQQLQAPASCNSPGCSCPDTMIITKSGSQVNLCGSSNDTFTSEVSTNGLKMAFCSDNHHAARGVLMVASKSKSTSQQPPEVGKVNDDNRRKRMAKKKSTLEEDGCMSAANSMKEMSHAISRMGCQYEYMMRLAQPDTKCPPISIMMELLQYDSYLMGGFQQDWSMCSGMDSMNTNLPMMNKLEECALQYLYRSRDYKFAMQLLNTTNGELKDIARMIVQGTFLFHQPPVGSGDETYRR